MNIKQWAATIEFKGTEGTDTARQTIHIGGNGTIVLADLPAKVASELSKAMSIIGEHADRDAKIKELTEEVEHLKAKANVLAEALEAEPLPSSEIPPPARSVRKAKAK